MSDVRDVFMRFVAALDGLDMDTMESVIHPDFVGEYPQSGERFRGIASFRAQLENYPGGLIRGQGESRNARVFGDERRWVITPGYTVLPLEAPERFTATTRAKYPDGTYWHIINIVEMRDDLIWRMTTYFAAEFEPPEWRAGISERYDRGNA